jgi:hypothetical protein
MLFTAVAAASCCCCFLLLLLPAAAAAAVPREWNTNTRNAHLAQVLLRAILSKHTHQQILDVPGEKTKGGGVQTRRWNRT